MDDVLGLLEHLVLCNPQRRPSDRDSEIIDLNTVKLADGNLDRGHICVTELNLPVRQYA